MKVHETVRTSVPSGCSTFSVALVKATSSIDSVQFVFGQSGAPAMVAGADVVRTSNGVVPFLISDAGIFSVPVKVIGAGFCPGAAFVPLFVQVEVTLPVAVNVITTSALPRPDSAPEARRYKPPSKNDGFAFAPPFRWTLDAETAEMVSANVATRAKRILMVRRIFVPYYGPRGPMDVR